MITIYSKTLCPNCTNAKTYLHSLNVDYTEINIDNDDTARSFLIGEGHRAVPQVYNESDYVGGWGKLQKMSKDQILKAGDE